MNLVFKGGAIAPSRWLMLMFSLHRFVCCFATASAFVVMAAGCAGEDSPASSPQPVAREWSVAQIPINTQLTRLVPPLRDQRFSNLLDFESPTDTVFLTVGHSGGAVIASDRIHTGRHALRLEPGTRKFSIRLSALLSSRPFPADWTLAGAFLYCDQAINIDVAMEGLPGVAPRTVALSPGRWTMALVDLASETAGGSTDGKPISLTFTIPPRAPSVWCDDVLLIDNSQTLVDRPEVATSMATTRPATPTTRMTTTAPWKIEKRGLNYVGQADGLFNFHLTTTEAISSGWQLDEANELRARFHSTGKTKQLTIFSDGRAYWDGVFHAMADGVRLDSRYAEQHDSPAEISVSEELGRVARDTKGDANNDGYNEERGAYQLLTTGSRIEFRITPHIQTMLQPAFEIRGLPPGKVLITSEGRLVETSVRLDDGTLLFELPGKIDRPTIVNVRLE